MKKGVERCGRVTYRVGRLEKDDFEDLFMPSDVRLYNRLTMFLHVLDQASKESVGTGRQPP